MRCDRSLPVLEYISLGPASREQSQIYKLSFPLTPLVLSSLLTRHFHCRLGLSCHRASVSLECWYHWCPHSPILAYPGSLHNLQTQLPDLHEIKMAEESSAQSETHLEPSNLSSLCFPHVYRELVSEILAILHPDLDPHPCRYRSVTIPS